MEQDRTLKYRADINGLRAIAVLSVLADHIGSSVFPGGFLGVDVFFVISGYLISGIILTEVKAGDFSIARFYERRVRRIFPALAAMMLATVVLAYCYFLPFETQLFSKSVLAATFCVSNMFFWGKSGYFEALATEKPLLHTWSLAVEEQFYFLFPLFLLLTYRIFRRKIDLVVVVLFVLSLAVGIAGAYYRPAAAFYLAPARAWELLLGSVISLEILPNWHNRVARNAATLVGVSLIGYSIVEFSAQTVHPGIASLVPCLGAALIIDAGRSGDSWVGRALSCGPMVFIGLISYSLYLWHWPIIVFHRVGFLPPLAPDWVDKSMLSIASIGVAALSWKYVETPFRNKQVTRKTLYAAALGSAVVLVLASVGFLATNGLSARFAPQVAQTAAFLDYDPRKVSRAGTCFLEATVAHANLIDENTCLHWDPSRKNYLLIGDSHAAHLWYGLATAFPDVNVMQGTAAGCKPTIDPVDYEDKRYCRRLLDYINYEYLPKHRVDTLLIEAVWREEDLPLLPHTLEFAKQYAEHVVLFGPMVQYDASLPRLLAVAQMKNDPTYPFRHRLDFLVGVDDKMAAIAQAANVNYVSFFKMLCKQNTCETRADDGVPMLYDYGHLTVEGSTRVATRMRDDGGLPQP